MSETRSVTTLQAAQDAVAHQREWFADLRAEVEAGAPLAVVNADSPHELFRAFGVPYVVNQWWASIVAAKQKSGHYLAELRERGYPDWTDQYGSLALASSLAADDDPPWGGLPRPTFLVAHLTDDAQRKIFELWARESGAAFFGLASTVANTIPPSWHERIQHEWEEVIGSDRLDLMVEELGELVGLIEEKTGRRYDEARLAEVMRLANEQAEWNLRTRDLIARTSPSPVSVADAIPAVMLPQWHRGTTYAVDAARALYDEVAARAAAGEGPNERVRLMWIGRGLWFNMGFYQHFEERYGAVFAWSMYLAVAADGYLRFGDDPLRMLAARFAAFGDQINMPPWSAEWYVKEALHNRIDGAVHLVGDAFRGAPFITRALEAAGVPVCELNAHNADQRAWDDEAMKARVSEFIETRIVKPLEGITVVDVTAALAGPYATFLLGALGARVIKVENPRGGDRVRNHPPFAGENGVTFRREADTDLSVPFLSRGRGKESVTLDLKHPDGAGVFLDLVRGADVVVDNFSRGTADRLGIGYAACSEANPRIVYCAISGFGAEGPVGEDKAYDTVIQALSGIMMLSGEEGDAPVKIGMPFADLISPLYGLIGILSALRVRDATGAGQFVDVSMLGAVTSLVASEPFELLERFGIPARTGNSTIRLTPFGVFRTADGHMAICATNDHECERLFDEMGMRRLLDDERFATVQARVENHGDVEAAVEEWTRTLPTAVAVARLTRAGVAVAPVREPKNAVRDEQVVRRGETARLSHPLHEEVGELYGPGLPIRFSAAETSLGDPPLLGQHSDSVYRDIAGYSAEHIAQLRARGVI